MSYPRKLKTWEKPLHWWMPWRRRALWKEWKRQQRAVSEARKE